MFSESVEIISAGGGVGEKNSKLESDGSVNQQLSDRTHLIQVISSGSAGKAGKQAGQRVLRPRAGSLWYHMNIWIVYLFVHLMVKYSDKAV